VVDLVVELLELDRPVPLLQGMDDQAVATSRAANRSVVPERGCWMST